MNNAKKFKLHVNKDKVDWESMSISTNFLHTEYLVKKDNKDDLWILSYLYSLGTGRGKICIKIDQKESHNFI